jgi:hypothetical protein
MQISLDTKYITAFVHVLNRYTLFWNIRVFWKYPYFDVVVGFVWAHDLKSYAGGSVCYW